MEFQHSPVLLQETIEGLHIRPEGSYVDCTVGGGGHSEEILKRAGGGRLVAIDQDPEALEAARKRLAPWQDQVTFVHGNFVQLRGILDQLEIHQVEGILMDLGISSHQLDEGGRGFSFSKEAELDMRMDQTAPVPTAKDIVNTYSQKELARVFYQYGEERWADRIASFIVQNRNTQKLETTYDLVKLINQAIPKKIRQQDNKHPATRVFQALRIEVNHELDYLDQALDQAVDSLAPGGRLAVISFHSLEDRLVKQHFKRLSEEQEKDPHFPVRIVLQQKKVKRVNKKPIEASEEEIRRNPRSRSAKLRIVEKLPEE